MDPTELFGTIHGPQYTISTNLYFYPQYFQGSATSFQFQQSKWYPNKPIVSFSFTQIERNFTIAFKTKPQFGSKKLCIYFLFSLFYI